MLTRIARPQLCPPCATPFSYFVCLLIPAPPAFSGPRFGPTSARQFLMSFFQANENVMAQWSDGNFYQARILSVEGDGWEARYRILYVEFDEEDTVSMDQLQALQRVRASRADFSESDKSEEAPASATVPISSPTPPFAYARKGSGMVGDSLGGLRLSQSKDELEQKSICLLEGYFKKFGKLRSWKDRYIRLMQIGERYIVKYAETRESTVALGHINITHATVLKEVGTINGFFAFTINSGESGADYTHNDRSEKKKIALKLGSCVVRREFKITNGEIKPGGIRAGIIRADYVLVYKNRKLAVIEAKKEDLPVSEGISQAKDYAQKLKIHTTYSTNGHKIYEINYSKNEKGEMFITSEGEVDKFPSPEELWIKTFKDKNEWSSKFDTINFEPFRGTKEPRYYQEIAIS